MNNVAANDNEFYFVSFVISAAVHVVVFACMVWGDKIFGIKQETPAVIYSVSLESSNLLGGINQIPTSDKKTPIAPPKKVSAPAKKQEPPKQEVVKKEEPKQVEAKKEEPKVEEKPAEDAEVSLAEKKTEKKKEEPKKEVAKKVEPKKEEKKPAPTPVKKVETKKPATTSNSKGSSSGRGQSAVDIERSYQQAMQRYTGPSMDAGGVGFGGDGRGGRGMGGGVLRPPEWFIYKENLETAVRKGWSWHQPNANLKASVTFRISPSGQVSDVSVSKSSGNKFFDNTVERAVWGASPVPIPPAAFYEDFKFVEIDFSPTE